MAIKENELKRLRREMEALKKKVARLEKRNGRRHPSVKRRAMASQRVQRDLRLRRHFGSVSLGAPTGADNESIDRDLAIEYGKSKRTS